MELLRNPTLRLKALLWAIALHSAAVGVGLILHPDSLLGAAGYQPLNEPFFSAQGGVFHLIMVVAYSMAAMDLSRNRSLIVFAVMVKIVATIFLFSYWIFVSRIFAVFASGMVDGAMAIAILLAFNSWRRRMAREAV